MSRGKHYREWKVLNTETTMGRPMTSAGQMRKQRTEWDEAGTDPERRADSATPSATLLPLSNVSFNIHYKETHFAGGNNSFENLFLMFS